MNILRTSFLAPPVKVSSRAFPKDLAKVVSDRWHRIIFGDYTAPPCPSKARLTEMLETVYLASIAPEEGRFPSFNIVAAPANSTSEDQNIGQRWPFTASRPLTVSELRRLAPAVDVKKSAIWLEWSSDAWRVVGLVDLGTSWHRARMGLEYDYRELSCLFVHIDRPGRVRVYQGPYQIAILSDGEISGYEGVQIQTAFGPAVIEGLKTLQKHFVRPKTEDPRSYTDFELTALWNTFAAIANSIAGIGHGGALVITAARKSLRSGSAKIKYLHNSTSLRSSFLAFVNARHVVGDLAARQENNEVISDEKFSHAEMNCKSAHNELVEATRFVAQLSGCDGAIVISEDLRLIGFGAEITCEFKKGWTVEQVLNDVTGDSAPLNIEQFGMRHRSAIKLVSQEPNSHVLVVSQDGPISAVRSVGKKVAVRRYVNLVNMDMW